MISEDEQEKRINFCLHKCGDGYCPCMKGKGGYPCVEFICEFCPKVIGMIDVEKQRYCKFCSGEVK